MWIRQISVRHFAGIRSAEVSFEHGLNVLYGPNEIGKSTLVDAMRAALLLQHGATAARDFEDWHADQPPQVKLTFETEPQRIWRVRKSFGTGRMDRATWSSRVMERPSLRRPRGAK